MREFFSGKAACDCKAKEGKVYYLFTAKSINLKHHLRKEMFSLSFQKNKGLREVLLFIAVAIFYKVSRYFAIGDEKTAFQNAYKVVHFEQTYGLFYEIALQHIFLNKTLLIQFLNRFYMAVHVPSIIAFFFWLFQRHRDKYYFIRNGFLFANFITLFIFMWYPCAPPRMLGDIGFVDTLKQISGINLYGPNYTHYFNQYAAMPSMHFGTALIIGICVLMYVKKWWLKTIMLLYPPFVLFVIVVTGNHFFLDAIVGASVSIIGFAAVYLFYKVKNKLVPPRPKEVEE